MALNPNMEDTTTFYISRQLDLESISLTSLSRGISFGGNWFTDAMTLSRSLAANNLLIVTFRDSHYICALRPWWTM